MALPSGIEYEPYHVHTYYSNCLTQPDSTMSIADYAKVYAERGHHVLCMSEHGNRSNVWQQFDLAQQYSAQGHNMTPLAAAECYFVPNRNPELKDGRNFHLIVIAKDMVGFKQLNRMLSEANVTGFYRHARVDFELLSMLDWKRFMVTTACVAGPLRDEEGLKYCDVLHEIFRDNFYLEIQHHPQEIQLKHNAKILDIYQKRGWPLIYATDSHYIYPKEAELRKELLLSSGINNGYEDEFLLDLPTVEEAYTKLQAQNVFSNAQIEEAMANTLQLRDFEGVKFDKSRKFPISRPDLTQEERNELYQKMVWDGYKEKAGDPSFEEAMELQEEVDTIIDTNSADYFIGLHDMLQRGIELGGVMTKTSRGSAASFATCYALGFTSINRLKCPVKMYPQRFISREKLLSGNMPDIDSNIANVEAFEEAGREIFGQYSCYPMIAYGKTKTLSAFKLLARARQLDFEVSNTVSKLIQNYELDRKHAIENNQDDPDYNVDDEIHIEQYVDPEYLSLIAESKQYQNIVVSVSPHPCAHLVWHKDLREEIGIIRLKPKVGSKEPQYCVYIDGATADGVGLCKSDLLRVDVVKTINDIFAMVGRPVMDADALLKAVENDPAVWELYARGLTMGLNQTEQPKTTERVKQFKPKNLVELAAFVAAIRPGAKSLVDTFVSRSPHTYGIPAMDNLLKLEGATGETGRSSYLFFDEQILRLAQAAGIDPADGYNLIKAIKKKKAEKVESYQQKFVPGFIKYLQEQEGTEQALAEKTAHDVWTVIMNSASYLFCSAHATAMAYDSLYGAYLKLHYPYEFYTTMLKLYTGKGNQEKISAFVQEMQRYQNIRMIPGRYGQDNRDWYIDREQHTISQSLSSIKYIPQQAAEDLYAMREHTFETFTDALRYMQMHTCLNTRQISVLIKLNYFEPFGKTAKLLRVFTEFFEGKQKLTKTIKSYEKRLEAMRAFESEQPDEDLPIAERVTVEADVLGFCISRDPTLPGNTYIVQNLDTKYGVKVQLYNLSKGTIGNMRVTKQNFALQPFGQSDVLMMNKWAKRQRYIWKNQKKTAVFGEYEYWLEEYTTVDKTA